MCHDTTEPKTTVPETDGEERLENHDETRGHITPVAEKPPYESTFRARVDQGQ